MRILYVINHAGYFLTHRLSLALAAREAGYDVHVATPESRHVPRIRESGLSWHPIRLTRSGRNPLRELLAMVDLVRLYRRLRPDLVHHVTSKPMLYGTAAARMTGLRAVVNAVTGLGHLHIARDPLHRSLRGVVGLGYRLLLRHRNMKVIFQNEDDRSLFVDSRWIPSSAAVMIRGSGVDMDRFRPAPRRAESEPVILFPSRMLRTKGIEELIGAARLLRARGVGARILLVGDPDPDNPASVTEAEIAEWVDQGLVEYWGRRDQMPPVYAEADIVCLPSYREGLPKSLVEAAAMGLPSVTTDVPGCRDVIRDHQEGLLVPLRSVEPLAAALETLARDRELRIRLGSAARERAAAEFSLDRVIEATLNLYRELLP
ncbi:MAG TPA: glycosyltransferase family 4 protein [Thermoanaerobaculia bacterium]|nr:glycosyltransferase family 4 protein [Thermoanaerobaculia bacterium]